MLASLQSLPLRGGAWLVSGKFKAFDSLMFVFSWIGIWGVCVYFCCIK